MSLLSSTGLTALQARSIGRNTKREEIVRRGWTIPHRYLSEKTQRSMLTATDVEERVLYKGDEWSEFVRNLRPGDEAVVADLRVFGSRKALGRATDEIEARGATLVVARRGIRIDPPTLREAHETERKWAGERSMGGSRRARELGARANAAKRAKALATRLPAADAEAIWRDMNNYPTRADAIKAMPGWSIMIAWRAFGPRER
jgi:hypothetical protein